MGQRNCTVLQALCNIEAAPNPTLMSNGIIFHLDTSLKQVLISMASKIKLKCKDRHFPIRLKNMVQHLNKNISAKQIKVPQHMQQFFDEQIKIPTAKLHLHTLFSSTSPLASVHFRITHFTCKELCHRDSTVNRKVSRDGEFEGSGHDRNNTRLLVNHHSRCFIAVTCALHMKLWGVHSVCTQTRSSAPAECQHSIWLGTDADDNSSKQDQADKPGI